MIELTETLALSSIVMREQADILERLPQLVRATRARRKLSLRKAAPQIGCSNSTLNEFELGRHDVSRTLAASMLRWIAQGP